MKKMINKTHIEGLVYENELKLGVAGASAKNPGSKYISGKLHIETTPNNVVTLDIFESEVTAKGEKNKKFATLENLLNAKTVIVDGRDNATKVRVDSALALNEWYREDGTLVSTPRNFNGFVHIAPTINPSATFEADIVIVKTSREQRKNVDGDMEETGRLIVSGIIFDYKNSALPINLVVENPKGIEHFENIEPYTLTKVWGNQVSSVIKTQKVEESAFGEPKVIETTSTRKELVITGALKDGYAEQDSLITKDELQKSITDRNVYLADLKAKTEERKNKVQAPVSTMNVADGMFNF